MGVPECEGEVARVHCDGHCLQAMMWNRPLEVVVAGRSTLEESYRRATTQEPIIERRLTQISRAGNPKRPHPNCQAGPTASSTPLFIEAQKPWGGHP